MKDETAHHPARRLPPPVFRFACSVQWDDMQVGAVSDTRYCGVCERSVHLCHSLAEFDQHARAGHCVAVYESGCFANMTTAPSKPSDEGDPCSTPSVDRPGPVAPPMPAPFDPTIGPSPRPTAGMPLMPGKNERPPEVVPVEPPTAPPTPN